MQVKVELPRRQAMLSIWRKCWSSVDGHEYEDTQTELARVPVLVWPMTTQDGCFIVEHQDGHSQKVQPYELTFLGSKELFDQYSWDEAEQVEAVQISEDKLVRHMVDKSGMTQSGVSEKMGKGRGYVLTMTSRGSSPSAANLAKLAKACGYKLVLEGHGESLCIVENDD